MLFLTAITSKGCVDGLFMPRMCVTYTCDTAQTFKGALCSKLKTLKCIQGNTPIVEGLGFSSRHHCTSWSPFVGNLGTPACNAEELLSTPTAATLLYPMYSKPLVKKYQYSGFLNVTMVSFQRMCISFLLPQSVAARVKILTAYRPQPSTTNEE